MELRHLEHFVAVAEEGSFTAAARRVHLVQSAVSVSLQALERELGTELIARTTRQLALTDAGRAFLPEARRTLDAADAARSSVLDVARGLRGTLRLGLMQSLTVVDVAGLLARFHRDRPLVEIRPRPAAGGSAALAAEVRNGTLDLAFLSLPGTTMPGLRIRPLASEPLLLTCPADHPLAARSSLKLGDLAGEPFVDLPPGWGTRRSVDAAFARAGLERDVAVEVPDTTTFTELVRAGLGVAIMPESFLPGTTGLVGVPLVPSMSFDVALAVPADRRPSPVAQAFLDLVDAAYPSSAEVG